MNTETKHTPGPWKAHATGLARSGKPEFEIHWSDDGECVAEIVHGEADARLVTAAPDLLAAAKVIDDINTNSEIYDEVADDGDGCVSTWQSTKLENALRDLRATIAKAEGRS